jgi:hypothetical protein
MWWWPIHKFWTFSPRQWLYALWWNLHELAGVPCPQAHVVFGVIIGHKGKRL